VPVNRDGLVRDAGFGAREAVKELEMNTKVCILLLLTIIFSQVTHAQSPSFQDLKRLFDYDQKAAVDMKEISSYVVGGAKVHDITYASPKGGRVTAFLIKPLGSGPFPAILFGHWGPGNRTEFLPEACLYAEAGVVSLLIDYPWRRPSPWRKSLENVSGPETDRAHHIQAVVDLRRGIDLLAALPEVDSKRLAYVGHSYGAQFGAIISAIDKRMKTFVLMGGTPDYRALWMENEDPDLVEYRKKNMEKVENYVKVNSPLDAINYISHAAPTPLLFQFAKREQYFNEAAMLRYLQAASEPKQVKWYDTGHDLNDFQALLDRADWLVKHVGCSPLAPILERRLKTK
jgi:cephalosporin-C deacetylase-like acetyl esterase